MVVNGGFHGILMEFYGDFNGINVSYLCQWIGLRENLQENPRFSGKFYGFL